MPVTEVKRRRGTAAQNDTFTGAPGEVTVDTTNQHQRVHNGTTPGGMPQASRLDVQNQAFSAAVGGGTANALTLDFGAVNNPAAYAKFQRFVFEAGANNTASATLNVGGLGNLGLRKYDSVGAKQELEEDDIVEGVIYEVMHDGSHFMLGAVASGGGGRTELISEATASVSSTIDIVLPGGYDLYLVEAVGVYFSASNTPIFRVSTDGGSSFITTGNYRWNNVDRLSSSATPSNTVGQDVAQIEGILGRATGSGVDFVWRSRILIAGAALGVNQRIGMSWRAWGRTSIGDARDVDGHGFYNVANQVDAIRFAPSSGTITAGTFRLWGLKSN